MKKSNFLILSVFCVALLAVYKLARTSGVKPDFPLNVGDSVGVYRVLYYGEYITADRRLKVTIHYIQLGDDDRCYQLQLSNSSESYFGNIHFSSDGETGTFACFSDSLPVTFIAYSSQPDCFPVDYLLYHGDSIRLYDLGFYRNPDDIP